MKYLDLDKEKTDGIVYLDSSNWPSPPTLLILDKRDILNMAEFYNQARYVSFWVIRRLQSVGLRYGLGNIILSDLDFRNRLSEKQRSFERLIPFCLQPYMSSVTAGVFLIKEEYIFSEFTSGSSGKFLKGMACPIKCIIELTKTRNVNLLEIQSKQNSPSTSILNHLVNAVLNIPNLDSLEGDQVLVEWITTQDKKTYFVDYQLMPKEFLPDCSQIKARPQIIYPGSFNFPTYQYSENLSQVPNDIVLVTDMPYLRIIRLCLDANIHGLMIKDGSFLSHVSKFAASMKLPCIFV